MSGRSNALTAYSQVANAEQNRLQQIVMLFDGAIRFLLLAAADIEARDLVAKAEHTTRAMDIISYLQSILDFEQGGEVAPALDALYATVTAMTLRASAKLDGALMRQAADQLAPVRDAWAVIAGAAAPDSSLEAPEH
jgi:flagellar protein FliS